MSRPRIDEADVKIISILQEEPRTSYLKLAKECQISIDSVRRRYDRLRTEGVIVSEVIALHPKAMGLGCFSWLGITTQPSKEKEVLKALTEQPGVLQNFIEIGKYNIRSILALEHVYDITPFVDSIKKIPYINGIDVMIWSDIERMAYPRNLVIETFHGNVNENNSEADRNGSKIKISSTKSLAQLQKKSSVHLSITCPSLDDTDEAIINVLSQNARIPFSTIAKQIGISTKTVICRYRKLKKDWVWYSTLSINLRKIGYLGYVSYHIKVSSKSWIADVFERIIKIPNIIVALKLIGPYDINALAPFSSPEQLMKVHMSISEIPGIERLDQQIGDSMHVWPPP